MNTLVRKLKRLFCKHEFVEDYVFYKTEFKYITGFASVYKCRKCGKVILKSDM